MTGQILEAMKAALSAHTWTTTSPASYLKGPIPPGHLTFPVIGIMATSGYESGRGRGYADTTEEYSWALSTFLKVGDLEAEYLSVIDWRDEARVLARDAVNGMWGLGAVRITRVTRWDTEFFEVPGPGGVKHLAEVTIKMEVEYREQAS